MVGDDTTLDLTLPGRPPAPRAEARPAQAVGPDEVGTGAVVVKARPWPAAPIESRPEPETQDESGPITIAARPWPLPQDLSAKPPSKKRPSVEWPTPTTFTPEEIEVLEMLHERIEPEATDGCPLIGVDSVCKHGHRSWPAHYGLVS